MEKNTVIAIILSTLVIVLGFTLQAKLFPPQETAQAAPRSIEMVNEPVTEETLSGDTALVTAVDDTVITNEADSAATETIDIEEDAKNPVAEARYTIETDLVRVIFTNRGGDVVSYQLKEHRDNGDPIEMAYSHDDNRAFSLVLGQENGKVVDELFNVRKISDTAIGFYRTFSVRNADGTTSNFTLVKQYSFAPDDYLFELKVTIDGDETLKGLQFGNAAYSLRTSPQIGPEWDQK
ncbi:MAG TPA: membrane protein insertase YidC, partial [Treponemataceae bacterium]|nr:membrane protein insertase YidC [Treponemataceae bacterium]